MKKEFYYVYCKGILGVRTNIKNFKWIYGSIAPETSKQEFEQCVVKFVVKEKPEKKLDEIGEETLKYQTFYWDEKKERLHYRRKLFGKILIGYDIEFLEDVINVNVGKTYKKLIRQRVMNLHGIHYLLADIANISLIKKGYFTLYASAIYSSLNMKGLVCFAPPNTGKTITATKLCTSPENLLIGEDIVITDGVTLFGCPWTTSYRLNKRNDDDGGSFGRIKYKKEVAFGDNCLLTDFVLLSRGKERIIDDKEELKRKILIVNGYLFNYYSSPIIKVLGYFKKEFDNSWNENYQKTLFEIIDRICCIEIQTNNPIDYEKIVQRFLMGGKYENFSNY